MLKLLEYMLKEEWRVHSVLFGNRSFSFFPIIVLIMSFVASMFLPLYGLFLSRGDMAAIAHFIFLFFGLSVGTFGLIGQEALNRRLGDVSFLAYASRTLPVSERVLFATFVLKDTLFYLLFLVIPFIAGYVPARLILGMSLASIPLLFASVTLAFLLGLSISFAITTCYAHFGKPLIGAAAVASFAYTLASPGWLSFQSITSSLHPLMLYLNPSSGLFASSVAWVCVLSGLCLAFPKIEYRLTARRYPPEFLALERRLAWTGHSQFIAKDLLDLSRSEGGLGKIVMSYAFPLAAVAVMVSFFSNLLKIEAYHIHLIMALMAGVISTSLYSWLVEFDFMEQYAFLPLTPSKVMGAKLTLYSLVTATVSVCALTLIWAYLQPPLIFLPLGILFCLSVAAYSIGVTVYLGGLRPNVMLYSGRLFLAYVCALVPVLAIPAAAYMSGAVGEGASILLALAFCAIMAPVGVLLLRRSLVVWDALS